MQQISKEYAMLFNAISDAEGVLQDLYNALILAQQTAEEIYISSDSLASPILTSE